MIEFLNGFASVCATIAGLTSLFFTVVVGGGLCRAIVKDGQARISFNLVIFVYVLFEVAVMLTCLATLVRFFVESSL